MSIPGSAFSEERAVLRSCGYTELPLTHACLYHADTNRSCRIIVHSTDPAAKYKGFTNAIDEVVTLSAEVLGRRIKEDGATSYIAVNVPNKLDYVKHSVMCCEEGRVFVHEGAMPAFRRQRDE